MSKTNSFKVYEQRKYEESVGNNEIYTTGKETC
jgi:hypothetical protein